MTAPAPGLATGGTLVARRAAGPYHVLSIAAPDVVAAAVPGQFVSVGVAAPETLLRRPFAVAGIDARAGLLDLVVAVVGRGSAWLTKQPASTALDVVGPLGRGFTMPDVCGHCVLVGGGYGVAALEWLASRLVAAGHTVDLCSGAASAHVLYPVRRPGGDAGAAVASDGRPLALHEVTEDGSRGRRGLVTDALTDRLTDAPDATVFACGPMPMLAAVARIAARAGCPCQVAVEEHMGCSVGVCMTCVVPTPDGYVRACVDGPVMDAAAVDWDGVLRDRSGR